VTRIVGALARFITSRLPAIGAGVLVVAAGLGARYGLTGLWAKYLGVTLWSTCAYVLVVLVKPSIRTGPAATVALAIGWGVEFAQLSPLPAYLSSKHLLLRWIFGADFSAWDLPAYAVGVAIGAGVHLLLRRRSGTRLHLSEPT